MRQLVLRPMPTLSVLLAVSFCLLMLSGVPRYRDATGGVDLVVGDVAWFGFLLTGLLFVVLAAVAVVRAVSSSRRTA